MRSKLYLAAGFCAALSVATPVFAGGPYVAVGGEVGRFGAETPFPTENYTGTMLSGRAGYDFGRYFGVEAEGALRVGGSAEVSRNFGDATVTFDDNFEDKVTSRYGVFLRGKVPTSDKSNLFLRVGLGARQSDYRSQGSETRPGLPISERSFTRDKSDSFAAIGAGFEYDLGDKGLNAIRAEFTSYAILVDTEDETFLSDYVGAVSYVRRF